MTWIHRLRLLVQRFFLALRMARTQRGRERICLAMAAQMPRILNRLATLYRSTVIRRTRIIAVVGSFGKTTTTRAVSAVIGSLNPRYIGWNAGAALPFGLLRIRPWTRRHVLEVGIIAENQMKGFATLIRPDLVVVTSIGSEHHRSFGTLETTRSEKAKMLEALPPSGIAILNADDPNVLWMQTRTKARVLTVGLAETASIRATDVTADRIEGLSFKLHASGATHEVQTRLIGQHMITPILAAYAVALAEGLDTDLALTRLAQLEPTPNRLQPVRHSSGAWLLLDAFKAAEETIRMALDAIEPLTATRKIVVLGDVEEPRGSQGPIYKALGLRVAEVADRVLFLGGKTNFNRLKADLLAGGVEREAMANIRGNPLEAALLLESDLKPGDLVLIKGRCTQHLERIALQLLGHKVGCVTRFCQRHYACLSCPRLRRGT